VGRQGGHPLDHLDRPVNSGVLSQGEAFGRIFRKAGTFKYHCTVHPSVMRGIITVT
jgi:plastocyanin